MQIYTKEYEEIIDSYWKIYVENNVPIPEDLSIIRPEILASWRRSQENGITAAHVIDADLAEDSPAFLKYIKKNQDLIHAARIQMETMYNHVIKGTDFALVLAEKNGYILDMMAEDPGIRRIAYDSGLKKGCRRCEKTCGTSGIALCLQLDRTFAVYGKEHYLQTNHRYICFAAPIHGVNGALIGCLALIGPLAQKTSHSLGVVVAIAGTIERELALSNTMRQLTVSNEILRTTLDSLANGVLLIDRQGNILQFNQRIREMFDLDTDRPPANLRSLLKDPALIDEILHIHSSLHNREVSVSSAGKESFILVMDAVCPAPDSNHLILSFEKTVSVRRTLRNLGNFSAKYTFDMIIGDSLSMRQVKSMGEMAAKSDANLLILGESGTGKDILAQAVHNASSRANGPFLPVNCASLPRNLIESELFGYAPGAFTGAQKNGAPGKFELAEGGTIFLDEIGDMPLELQTAFLRVLQNKEVVRVGGKESIPIDVRVITATNAGLLEAVTNGDFRSDLFYRINVLSVTIPPLRYRKEDIPTLVDYFSDLYTPNDFHMNYFTPEDMQLLMNYDWPGNVRELENMVERVIVSSGHGQITTSQVLQMFLQAGTPHTAYHPGSSYYQTPYAQAPAAPSAPAPMTPPPVSAADAPRKYSPAQECDKIKEILRREHGHVPTVAEEMQIPLRTLYRKIKKYNINLEEYRSW